MDENKTLFEKLTGLTEKKVMFVIGLPGSGKTYYMENTLKPKGFTLVDDIENTRQIPNDKNLIAISDVNLCVPEICLMAFHSVKSFLPEHNINFLTFENDPEKCKANVKYRNDGRDVMEDIDNLTKIYQPMNPVEIFDTRTLDNP